MRIGLAYNQKPDPANSAEEPPSTNDAFAEWDDPSTIAAVEQALGLFGSVIRLEADPLFPQQVALARPDLVFNMAEDLRVPQHSLHRLGPPHARALAPQGAHQRDPRLPRRAHRTVRLRRNAAGAGAPAIAVSGVREAGRGGVW